MALGKTHDKLNLFAGSLIAGLLIGIEQSWPVTLSFCCGWLLATLIFGPDTDIMPKKRAKLLRLFLFPYSLLFKHRGVSHNLLLGTLTRVVYGVATLGLLVFILNKMGYIPFTAESYLSNLQQFLQHYDYQVLGYRMVTWFFLGMFVADFCHVMLDKITDIKNRILRLLFK